MNESIEFNPSEDPYYYLTSAPVIRPDGVVVKSEEKLDGSLRVDLGGQILYYYSPDELAKIGDGDFDTGKAVVIQEVTEKPLTGTGVDAIRPCAEILDKE